MPPKREKGKTHYPNEELLKTILQQHAVAQPGALDFGEYTSREGPFVPTILKWVGTLNEMFKLAPNGLVSWGNLKRCLADFYMDNPMV